MEPMNKANNQVLLPSDQVVEVVQQNLLEWYGENKRDLPWRENKNPYRIWVSEIMLQQTRVDTVIPYYERFLSRFPTIESLAAAADEDVIKAWEGLGYYSRARNLHSAVKEVVAEYGGKVPDKVAQISKLKGVGPYTTGAILSIAYDKKVPAVDGNVMRVFSRLFTIEDDISQQSTRKKMERIAEKLIPESSPGDFNQALMELGAMVCTPQSPKCLFCPVQSVCKAYQQGRESELPRKKKATSPKSVDVIFVWIVSENKVLIEKRPEQGLLAHMWSLPTIEQAKKENYLEVFNEFCDTKNIQLTNLIIRGNLDHIFSHIHWKITLVQADLKKSVSLPDEWEWIALNQLHTRAFPNVYRKALQQLVSI
ncbi:A/G-specific adenine glycosylase [Hazenella coriacea]|uniref:Adenine DNA glycosylase n=1 Tax=Hazenella coriacea TaxID=1179467 RepID=A0A4R3L0T2_9BACL|nr:A/G-specific adenine glycosylase [Hazenella coriacea]TCS92802.1 A/G-specific DNA-adenine glycosylase [Hazenella coriacea]